MSDTTDVVRNSPVDFSTAVGYALHRPMRWLIVLFVVGSVLLPAGLQMATSAGGGIHVISGAVGFVIAFVGAAFKYGGLVGIAFKVIVDGATLALERHERSEG